MNKILIAALCLVGLTLACTPPRGNNSGATSPAPVVADEIEPEITLAEYDQIQSGMTYEQVKDIVGVAGEVTSGYDAQPGYEQYSTKSYTFKGWYAGANAVIMFQGGRVQNKFQFSLR